VSARWLSLLLRRHGPSIRVILRPESSTRKVGTMLNRVAVERAESFVDLVLDFTWERSGDWPDLVEISAKSDATSVRLRVHEAELETLAVALDSAYTGGTGELYFRGSSG
jgi:hypothetical protein